MTKSQYANVYPTTEAEFLEKLREVVAAYPGGSGFAAEIGIITGAETPEVDSYSAGAYAMRDAAVLAFNYAAHLVGASGFQGSIAALEAYSAIVGKESIGVMDLDDLLYPQYDLHRKLDEWIASAKPRLREKAMENLAKYERDGFANEAVVAHWRRLAA